MRFRGSILTFLLILTATVSIFAQDVTPKSKWAKLDNNKNHYYDIGNRNAKDALVFIHCWTCNAEFWKDSYNAFPGYRVIAIDLPDVKDIFTSIAPNIDFQMWPGVSHFLHMEKPKEFNEQVSAFIVKNKLL